MCSCSCSCLCLCVVCAVLCVCVCVCVEFVHSINPCGLPKRQLEDYKGCEGVTSTKHCGFFGTRRITATTVVVAWHYCIHGFVNWLTTRLKRIIVTHLKGCPRQGDVGWCFGTAGAVVCVCVCVVLCVSCVPCVRVCSLCVRACVLCVCCVCVSGCCY